MLAVLRAFVPAAGGRGTGGRGTTGGTTGRGGRGGRGTAAACPYTDAASLTAALTGLGCDATGADCSARCAEGFLPLMRECRTLMQP